MSEQEALVSDLDGLFKSDDYAIVLLYYARS
jgi:hypothetical protein